jgi:four helix bundle protein
MTNDSMNSDDENNPGAPKKSKFDLEERTACFGGAIIRFAKTLPRDVVDLPLISQLVRAGTSIGANYCEADDAVSKKDYRNKIGTCKKEARETKYWLRMIVAAESKTKLEARFYGRRPRNCTSFLRQLYERVKQCHCATISH